MSKKQLIALFAVGIIILIAIISSFFQNNDNGESALADNEPVTVQDGTGESKVTVSNSSSLDFLTTEERDYIYEYTLFLLTDTNVGAPEAGEFTGTIRDGSVDVVSAEDRTDFSFIMDFPNAKKSWGAVISRYDLGGGDIDVYCLEPDQLLYGEFECVNYGQDAL